MYAPSIKFLVALLVALVALVSVSSAAPLTASELKTRSAKVDQIRQRLEELKEQRGPPAWNKNAHEHANQHAGRGTKQDNNPQDCGFGRITCPVSYNGLGRPVCDFGNCKLECPRGLRQFFSRHPEFPSFCA
ncbi:hypothetical protein JCM10212_001862 [Sporobolomyces blumeae]